MLLLEHISLAATVLVPIGILVYVTFWF